MIDDRDIWRSDLARVLERVAPPTDTFCDRLWVAPSCSLLHAPVGLSTKIKLDDKLKGWLAFMRQKLDELAILKLALVEGPTVVQQVLDNNRTVIASHAESRRMHNAGVKKRVAAIRAEDAKRAVPCADRTKAQQTCLNLPLLPTTTVDLFP